MISQYSKVMLLSDAHEDEGARRGMVGYVIEVYGDGNCEVEFSDPATGTTVAQLVLAESELAVLPA